MNIYSLYEITIISSRIVKVKVVSTNGRLKKKDLDDLFIKRLKLKSSRTIYSSIQ